MKHKKFFIAAIPIVLVLGFLGYKGFASSATYYYTVAEFAAQQSAFVDKNVRVEGKVAEGTVDRKGTTVKFTMTDGTNNLPVTYTGVIPDTFKDSAEAVVEGKLNSAGVFEANTLLAKCPSKYEAQQPEVKN